MRKNITLVLIIVSSVLFHSGISLALVERGILLPVEVSVCQEGETHMLLDPCNQEYIVYLEFLTSFDPILLGQYVEVEGEEVGFLCEIIGVETINPLADPNSDADDDGIIDLCDNCWYVANPNQLDTFGLDCSEITIPYREDPVCGDECDCYQEGETFFPESEYNCCDGLVNSSCCAPSEPIGRPDSCSCAYSCRKCVKCGDGICGIGENWCICIQDCPRPEEIPCTEDSQCGRDMCQQGANVCHEFRFTCTDGECLSPAEEEIFVNYSCNLYYGNPNYPSNQCIDSCGDDICHTPETRSWCPEDCDCEDMDGDLICDDKDNCPETANSFYVGTCSNGDNIGNPCTVAGANVDECGTNGFCSMDQDDGDGDCIGDLCDEFPDIFDPSQPDTDSDGIADPCDSCPDDPENDPDEDEVCGSVDNCPTIANPNQEDTCPPEGNGIGDACDCEGNFDDDEDCDGTDAATFKVDFGRSTFDNPCEGNDPCNGGFDCDGDCDGTDAAASK